MSEVEQSRTRSDRARRFAEALGADESLTLIEGGGVSAHRLELLAAEVGARLRSTGGRPTDQSWAVTRQVPFSVDTWARLGRLANDLSARGRRIAPTQVAAMLVEDGLKQLQNGSSPEELDEHLKSQSKD